MGCHCSKMPGNVPSVIHSNNHQAPTDHGENVSLPSLSLDALKEATARLLEINLEIVGDILNYNYKKEIRKNPKLLVLVNDYLDKGIHNPDFCNDLKKYHEIAQNLQLGLHLALLSFDQADDPSAKVGDGTKYEKIIDELKRFKESGNFYAKELLQVFQLVRQDQLQMLQELLLKKKKLDRKLKSVKAWKKLSCIVFTAAPVLFIILSIVAAIPVAPLIVATISAVCSAMNQWFYSVWNDRNKAIEREKKMTSSLKAGISAGIKVLNDIMDVMNKLEGQISSLPENGKFKFSDEKAVRSVIEETGKIIELSMKSIEDLAVQVDKYGRGLKWARTIVSVPENITGNQSTF